MSRKGGFRPSWKRRKLTRLLLDVGRRVLVLGVWLGAGAAAVFLLREPGASGYPGTLEPRRWTVRAPADGVLAQWLVAENDVVEEGQLLGILDDAELLLRAEGLRHDIARLRAEAARSDEEWQTRASEREDELLTDLRRFQRDLEEERFEALQLRAELEEDRIRVQSLAIDVGRLERLLEQELATEEELTAMRLRRDALQERIEQNELLAQMRDAQVETARSRLAELQPVVDAAGDELDPSTRAAPWSHAQKVRETELEEIALARERLRIIAPATGTLEAVPFRPQQVLRVGETLGTILGRGRGELVAWVPEADLRKVQIGASMTVASATRDDAPSFAVISRIGSTAVLLPTRHWLDPQREEWAVPVYLTAGEPLDLLPGEALLFRADH